MISLSNDSLMEVMSYLTYNESKKFSYTCKTVNKVCYLKNLIGPMLSKVDKRIFLPLLSNM